jgi:hypothetical protein
MNSLYFFTFIMFFTNASPHSINYFRSKIYKNRQLNYPTGSEDNIILYNENY